ncbi:beta-N-acetylhexosaminidase [Streptomyces beijiangensis]|uniref:beta-N-acetylhexosaminidase n=1 Tax=Streptomyces beijiangensis TaxID=163361 RepID=A0A939JJM2_9ACTN|nr:beta-N-acetylhexosaminidase [Streptomyces beijiangensis]MBO0516723.1 beta-N-acetylhexosaminidase [Streptomyces beijiangensis]
MIVPRPAHFALTQGEFTLTADTPVLADPPLERAARLLRAALAPSLGAPPPDRGAGPAIRFRTDPGLGDEAYRLTVVYGGVFIEASGHAGAFYAVQTLLQLLPAQVHRTAVAAPGPLELPCATVADEPRFGWRGTLIDVARRFLPKRELLRYIDLLALHKLNVLHLHLTDDQGWRIEIKRCPRLTEVGSWRRESTVGSSKHGLLDGRPHGGFYTQDDIREIVAYAAERAITVVPEIDLPGHTQAAIAAYPELGNTGRPVEVGTAWGPAEHVLNAEDSTVEFFKGVYEEVLDLFPSRYVCVGGDECVQTEWRESPRVQERMRELGLDGEDALQSWYIRQFDTFLTERGRKLLGWDEILAGGLAEGATVMSWRGMQGAVAAAKGGNDVVACPLTDVYFDFRQSEHPDEPIPVGCATTVEDAYAFEPVPSGLTPEEAVHVLGGQAQLWTEPVDGPRGLDYLAFPRISAFAEAVWSTGERSYAEFEARLVHHLKRLDALGVEYRPLAGPHPWQTRPDARGRPRDRAAMLADVLGGPEQKSSPSGD